MTLNLDTSPLRTYRQELAAWLVQVLDIPVHPAFTAKLQPPCIVLEPAGVALHSAARWLYTVRVSCLYAGQGAPAADLAEEMARQAVIACQDLNWRVSDIPPATELTTGEGDNARSYTGVQFGTVNQIDIREVP